MDIIRVEKHESENLFRGVDFSPNLGSRVITSFSVEGIDLSNEDSVNICQNAGIINNTVANINIYGGVIGGHYKIIVTCTCHDPASTLLNPIPDEIQIEDVFVDVVDD